MVLQQATPLSDQIKRGRRYALLDFQENFKNIHNSNITPTQKQIVYRILYNITPTSEGLSKRTNRVHPCKICNKNIQETEEHIFYLCESVRPTLNALKLDIQKHFPQTFDLYKAVFLNIIPKTDKENRITILQILALYRETLWHIRLQTRFKDRTYTPEIISQIFTHKAKHLHGSVWKND